MINLEFEIVDNGRKTIPLETLPMYVKVGVERALREFITRIHEQGYISIGERDRLYEEVNVQAKLSKFLPVA